MKNIYRCIKEILLLSAALLLPILPPAVVGAAEQPPNPDRQPIQITSDRLEAFNEERLVIFAGHAVAVQGDKVIRAEKLKVYYKQSGGRETPEGALGQGGDLDRIVALGKVRITQRNRVVTGDEATYFQDEQKIVVSGNALMREGENVVRGDRITVMINEKKGVVEGTPAKRVTATIYPDEASRKKKPLSD